MCIIYYYICSKCYCGYPRYTSRCPFIHPPLIYCPRGTEFKLHIVAEQECHICPHKTPTPHLRVDSTDTALSVGSSGSKSRKESFAESHTAHRSAPTYLSTPIQACHNTDSNEIKDEKVPALDNATQLMRVGRQPVINGGLVNGCSRNKGTTPSQVPNRYHTRTACSETYLGGNLEVESRGIQYSLQQSTPNGYQANRAGSGAPFDRKHHPHIDPQRQYYLYQQPTKPPIEFAPQSNLPRYVYMEVEGPGRYYQHHGSTVATSSNLSYNPMTPRSITGGNTGVPEPNRLQLATNRKSPFNPKAAEFDYWKMKPNPPSHGYDTALETAYNIYKSRKCHKSLEQLQRSNEAAYYDCHRRGNHRGVAIEDGRDLIGNRQPEPSSENGGYSVANVSHEHCSESRGWSESYSGKASTSEDSYSIDQDIKYLSHTSQEPNARVKGKEVIRNPALSWINKSTPASSAQSDARVELWNGYCDASTQTDDHPISSFATDHQEATSPRHNESEGPPEVTRDCDNANSDRDAPSTDEVVNNYGKNSGIISFKTEPDGEYYQAGDLAEPTPTNLKMDPDDEVKLHDIPPAPTIQTSKSATDYESQSVGRDSATPEYSVPKRGVSQGRASSTHRSLSSNAAPSMRCWSDVVAGRYVPSKLSGVDPRQHTTPIKASNEFCADKAALPTLNALTDRSVKPIEPTSSPEMLNAELQQQPPDGSNWASDIVSVASSSPRTMGRTDSASVASDNFTGAAESKVQGQIGETTSTETIRRDPGVRSPKSPDNIRSSSLTLSANSISSASRSVAPNPPRQPQPRLWSQLLFGETKFACSTKSKSNNKDKVDWPSLESDKTWKRNTTP